MNLDFVLNDDLQSPETATSGDAAYGALRGPSSIQPWENGNVPASKVALSIEIGKQLQSYRDLSGSDLFGSAAICFQFIWAMDANCQIYVAFEELWSQPASSGEENRTGHPRRRGFPAHPAEEKKLGHPTLLEGGPARAAGELFLDEDGSKLQWYVNVASGRYCRLIPPTQEQCGALHRLFTEMIDSDILWDGL